MRIDEKEKKEERNGIHHYTNKSHRIIQCAAGKN